MSDILDALFEGGVPSSSGWNYQGLYDLIIEALGHGVSILHVESLADAIMPEHRKNVYVAEALGCMGQVMPPVDGSLIAASFMPTDKNKIRSGIECRGPIAAQEGKDSHFRFGRSLSSVALSTQLSKLYRLAHVLSIECGAAAPARRFTMPAGSSSTTVQSLPISAQAQFIQHCLKGPITRKKP